MKELSVILCWQPGSHVIGFVQADFTGAARLFQGLNGHAYRLGFVILPNSGVLG
jgi:hypothetical protein